MVKTVLTPKAELILILNHFRGEEDECWPYLGIIRKTDGYGSIQYMKNYLRTEYLAHRVAYLYYNKVKEIYNSVFICHSCDNPPCVNPKHLFKGTYQDNIDDMVSKKRHQYGRNHSKAILSEEEVRQIRYEASLGHTHQSIADKRGICRQSVSYIVSRKLWKHVK